MTHASSANVDLTASCVRRLRSGDRSAGQQLCELYRKPIFRFCLGFLGRADAAEDAVQEVFCKILTAQDVPVPIRPWIYKVARNHCLNVRRGWGRRRDAAQRTPDSDISDTLTGCISRLVKAELRSHLARRVAALPESAQELLRLRYVEDLSRSEMADVLELPESVVKSRLYEAVQALRQSV